MGQPVDLSTDVGGLSQVALAATSTHAAAVYTVQNGSISELRFRPLDRAGQPTGAEIKLTAANRSVTTPSIAAHPSGFVIAFRESPRELSVPAGMRLLFVTSEGRLRAERRIADAARSGSQAQVFTMNDGRLIVLWSDSAGSGTTLRGVRAHCR